MPLVLLLVCLYFCIVAPRAGAHEAEAGQRYANSTYGFTVTIPSHLSTTTAPPPAPQHGIAVTLSPAGHAWIDGSYDARFLGSASAALRDLATDESVAGATPIQAVKVSGLAAARLRYTRDSKVAVRVIAFRPRSSDVAIIYTFGLDTDDQHAKRDEMMFDRILRSFTLLPLPK
jgi:hypothetical protein